MVEALGPYVGRGTRQAIALLGYEVLQKIGQGGNGKVYRVIKEGDQFALKVLNAGQFHPREAIILKKLEPHENIAQLIGVDQIEILMHDRRGGQEQRFVIVQEYVPGLDLWDFYHLQPGVPFSGPACRYLFKQIIVAVSYCHKHGVAHRDLTLKNIMIRLSQGSVKIKIIDFGGATEPRFGSAYCRTFTGTPGFMPHQVMRIRAFNELLVAFGDRIRRAPYEVLDQGFKAYSCEITAREYEEFQMNGEWPPYNGVKADIFSLGVSFFFMCKGRLPFGSTRTDDPIYQLVMQGNAQAFWELHGGGHEDVLEDLLWGMLRHQESDRLDSHQILSHPFLQETVNEGAVF